MRKQATMRLKHFCEGRYAGTEAARVSDPANYPTPPYASAIHMQLSGNLRRRCAECNETVTERDLTS
jgi:hypothetical protein